MAECFENNFNKVDKYIYHYTSLQKGLEYILKGNSLRFSPFGEVNDPKESQRLSPYFPDINNYLKESTHSEVFDNVFEVDHYINEFRNKHKVLCFSRDSDRFFAVDGKYKNMYRGYNKPTFWSHYADKHKGLCLIFDKEKLIDSVYKAYGSNKDFKIYDNNIVKYKYLENIIENFDIKYEDILNLGIDKATSIFLESRIPLIFFTKVNDWEMENEFRVVISTESKDPKDKYLYIPINESLCGIVMGSKMSTVYWSSIKEFKIPCAQLKWRNGMPYLQTVLE